MSNLYFVLKNNHNYDNLDHKLIGKYFVNSPERAQVRLETCGTFAKIWKNEAEISALTFEEIAKIEKDHSNLITKNLVKTFRPIAKFV